VPTNVQRAGPRVAQRNNTPSDCFETFPFPPDWTTDPELETAGEEDSKQGLVVLRMAGHRSRGRVK